MTEYADHLHEHMMDPVTVENGCFKPPKVRAFYLTHYQTTKFKAGPN